MLNSLSHFTGASVIASDGAIGQVKAAFFDDARWVVRYLVVNTGNWLSGREVLISPYAVKQPVGDAETIQVTLNRQQVENSPDIDTHQPVSRQHERTMLDYYAYPTYWDGGGLWEMGAYPLMTPLLPTAADMAASAAMQQREQDAADPHLRSSAVVIGYDILASDGSIGHVGDFIFDDESFAIRYLVIDTRNWWPGGRKVLVGTHWIDAINWETKTVRVSLTREQVRASPAYDAALPVQRDYEQRLHDALGRQGYWN